MNLGFQSLAQAVFLKIEIVPGLKVQPEEIRSTKEFRQTKSGVGGDGSLTLHNLVDSACGHARILREPVLSYTKRTEKLLGKDLARMNRI